nr:peptidyl-trna hydrolase, mitochondrial [Quercus suber]
MMKKIKDRNTGTGRHMILYLETNEMRDVVLKSVIDQFRRNREFPRLRIGIGRPPGQMDPKAFLLQKFNARAQERIDTAMQEGVSGLKLLLSRGLTESARSFNREQKYKHIRLQTMPT